MVSNRHQEYAIKGSFKYNNQNYEVRGKITASSSKQSYYNACCEIKNALKIEGFFEFECTSNHVMSSTQNDLRRSLPVGIEIWRKEEDAKGTVMYAVYNSFGSILKTKRISKEHSSYTSRKRCDRCNKMFETVKLRMVTYSDSKKSDWFCEACMEVLDCEEQVDAND